MILNCKILAFLIALPVTILGMPASFQSSIYNIASLSWGDFDANFQNAFLYFGGTYSICQVKAYANFTAIPMIRPVSNTFAQWTLITRDGSLAIIYASNTQTIYVYNITNGFVTNTAKISLFVGFTYSSFCLSDSGRYLAFTNGTTQSLVYKYANPTYVSFSQTLHAAIVVNLRFSPDQQFYSVSIGGGNTNLNIYQITSGALVQVVSTNFSIGPLLAGSSGLFAAWSQKSVSGNYDIAYAFTYPSYYLKYLTFDGVTLTQQQNLFLNNSTVSLSNGILSSIAMAPGGQYLTVIDYLTFHLLIYQKNSSGSFQLVKTLTNIPEIPRFVFFDTTLDLIYVTSLNYIHFSYSCDILNCLRCSWKNICSTCNSNLTLFNNSCTCTLNQTQINNSCINCTVSNCNQCSTLNHCSSCINGYDQATDGSCICAPNKNVSLITNLCNWCNLTGCSYCIEENTCMTYSPSDLKSTDTSMTVSAIIVVVVIIFILMIVGFIFILFKISKLSSTFATVSNADINKTQIPEQSDKLTNFVKNKDYFKQIESKAELNDKSMETLQNKSEVVKVEELSELDATHFNSQPLENEMRVQLRKRKINKTQMSNKIEKEEDQELEID